MRVSLYHVICKRDPESERNSVLFLAWWMMMLMVNKLTANKVNHLYQANVKRTL